LWENPIKFWAVTEADYRRFLDINTLAAVRLASLVAPPPGAGRAGGGGAGSRVDISFALTIALHLWN
jgi:NAD(P)-dependent dehydrogenase (short-subunit alcohol dehydrogenase family)